MEKENYKPYESSLIEARDKQLIDRIKKRTKEYYLQTENEARRDALERLDQKGFVGVAWEPKYMMGSGFEGYFPHVTMINTEHWTEEDAQDARSLYGSGLKVEEGKSFSPWGFPQEADDILKPFSEEERINFFRKLINDDIAAFEFELESKRQKEKEFEGGSRMSNKIAWDERELEAMKKYQKSLYND